MRMLIILFTAILGFVVGNFLVFANDDNSGDAALGATKAQDCTACHNSMISLKGRGADTIADQINAIRSGDQNHPPGLEELKEVDILDIAAFLDGA